ncbi:MAG TPA: hypothetical protein VJY42_05085 [Candidatus Methanomethylophilaceae archaeon]|nr:hypothetical protein [Candidatus Methanomethylophilaceae archaeon]
MANSFEKLTPSEVTRIFSKMSPLKATRYYNKVMTNPDTPNVNVDLFRQYRAQNENKFLSDEQMRSQRNKGSWNAGKGYGGGYRDRSYGRTYGSEGNSYDNRGRSYDRYGNEQGGYNDGGYDQRNNRSRGGFSDYYGGGRMMRGQKIDVTQPRSYDQVGSTMDIINNDIGRTKYFMAVINNPKSNQETITNLVKYRNANPGLFAADDVAMNTRTQRRDSGRGFWSSLWKSDAEFNSMSPRKKQFFVGAFKRKNRSKNAAYSLRVLTNPNTPVEDKKVMVEVVNENPKMFFSKDNPSGGRNNN